MSIIIREAQFFDLGQIISMQIQHRRDISAYGLLTFDKDKCTESMASVLSDMEHTVLVAHENDSSKILGYMWITAVAPHYSYEFFYSEQYTYVLPDRRGGLILSKLIKRAIAIAKRDKASYLNIGSFSGNDKLTAAYAKRYKRLGIIFEVDLHKA